jgi:hypothetical protein
LHSFASFLMSCEEDPVEYIDAHRSMVDMGDSRETPCLFAFPCPPRRSTTTDPPKVAGQSSTRTSSRRGNTRKTPARSRSPTDEVLSPGSNAYFTPPRRPPSGPPREPLPPVPPVPERYRRRSSTSTISVVGNNEDVPLHPPIPRRTADLQSCKALQEITGMTESSVPSIPLLELQAASLQVSSDDRNQRQPSRTLLPCPQLLPPPTTSPSPRSSLDGCRSSSSSTRSSRKGKLPERSPLPQAWRQ